MFKPVDPKIDFVQKEKEILEKWELEKTLEKYLHRNDKSTQRFSFLDGPITANNPMGVHHGWGRTYKDLYQRFWNMRGYKQRFQNGFDCQGLWVEVEVEKELGIRNKKDIENLIPGDRKASIAKFVSLCKERVIKFSSIQTKQSKRLGYFMDWDNSYYTMSDENNYMIWHFLKTCHEKGWIYKGKDSVPWCPRCETAISQHEMLTEDYKEVQHETVFIKFPIINLPHKLEISPNPFLEKRGTKPNDFFTQDTSNSTTTFKNNSSSSPFAKGGLGNFSSKKISLLVWTTTPWTIPANVAVAVNTKFTYFLYENTRNGEIVIFIGKDENGLEPLRNFKGKDIPVSEYIFKNVQDGFKKIGELSGKDLIGTRYAGPFDHLPIVTHAREEHPKTFHKVIDGSKIVVSTEGTGLLHVAPGAGKEDFDLSKTEHLSIISPIDDTAVYIGKLGEFSGKNAKKHPELIIDYLKNLESGRFLFKTMHYTHRYPSCWRCKTELVWKITDEWYIAMDTPSKSKASHKTLRQEMIGVAKKIKWLPAFGLDRELDWLTNMNDWLISKKNRYWGLALPIYECNKCGHFDVIGSREELKGKTATGWQEFSGHTPHKPYIDEVRIKCASCGQIVSRIDDVGNVWLDAGIVPFSTYIDPQTNKLSYTTDKKYWKKWFPADFITESFPGQFKNWFYSMIAMSAVLEQTNSFKTIFGYALVLAEDGRPMHKSWGNAIEFNEGAEKIGVDVMRWLYLTADPEQNLLFGYKKADEVRRRFFLMLWNIYNFFITYALVDKWNPDITKFSSGRSGNILDTWIISRLHSTIKTVTLELEKYDSQKAVQSLELFIQDLSLWYIRRSRERVGPSAENQNEKKYFYETTYAILLALCKLLSPFIPFISEEIYTNLTDISSVHLANWPQAMEQLIDSDLEKNMAIARELASVVLMKRKSTSVKVRIPLKKLKFTAPDKLSDEIIRVVAEEVNVEELIFTGRTQACEITNKDEEITDPSNQDRELGLAREIVRQIQEERKKLATGLDEKVNAVLPEWPILHEAYIKRNALINQMTKGAFQIKRI